MINKITGGILVGSAVAMQWQHEHPIIHVIATGVLVVYGILRWFVSETRCEPKVDAIFGKIKQAIQENQP